MIIGMIIFYYLGDVKENNWCIIKESDQENLDWICGDIFWGNMTFKLIKYIV